MPPPFSNTHYHTVKMKYTVLTLGFLATAASRCAAWIPPTSSISHTRSSLELQMINDDDDMDMIVEQSASLDTMFDRRNFFHSASVKAAGVVALTTTSTASCDVAYAEDLSTSYSKIYTPEPHSMDNKIVVITGGNSGLGLESSKRLAKAGATVVFTSRDNTKGEAALDEVNEYIKEEKANDSTFAGKAMMASLDLCDLDNTKSFRDRLAALIGKDTKIDVLLNNAGVMAIPDQRLTKDGFEKTFQTNHLGHFALTSTLLPQLSKNARIINVSSLGYQFAGKGLDLDNLNGEQEYGPWSSYGESKLENILFTNELQKRAHLSDDWSNLKVFSLHPGAVQTDLARYLIGEEKFADMKLNGFSSLKDKIIMESLAKFVLTVEQGASTQVYLAAASGVESNAGKFFSDGKPQKVKSFATDEKKAEELWTASEKLAGVKFDL